MVQIYACRQMVEEMPLAETGVIMGLVGPGVSYTGLSRHGSFAVRWIIYILNLRYGRPVEQASATLLHGAVAEKECHGRYLMNCRIGEYVATLFTDRPSD